ncbi:hypothetical protein CYY_005914 [Polysphondylium violaceum]|uniref:N-acetyltransferase domain-containing protein n=1 Tax=Polysphondylium violaceum TaxID=133409 RepID=A0A8J4PR91_9MYCE|nr:hypothetical protein CYY_005914 [Polysphondylium violaceum]
MNNSFKIERFEGIPSQLDLSNLSSLLYDCVVDGASIGFLTPFSVEKARVFWDGLVNQFQSKSRILFVARDISKSSSSGNIVGTVQLILDMPDNGVHRGEIVKLMVSPLYRRMGIAKQLLEIAEQVAKEYKKTLLVLDTNTGEGAELLYQSIGYKLCGVIPNFSISSVDRSLKPTSYMYKLL